MGGGFFVVGWNCSFRGPEVFVPRVLRHLFHVLFCFIRRVEVSAVAKLSALIPLGGSGPTIDEGDQGSRKGVNLDPWGTVAGRPKATGYKKYIYTCISICTCMYA